LRFKKVNPSRQIPAAKATPVINSQAASSPGIAAQPKQEKPRPPPVKPPIIEYKYSREIIDLRPADQARNLSKDGSALPGKKDPIRILSKHILTAGAAANNPDSERKLISKPRTVAVQLKKPEAQSSPNPKHIIEINKLQSLRLTRNESTQIPPSTPPERHIHDLSISNQSHQSLSGFNQSINSPHKSDIRAARQISRTKNVPNLLEKIQKRKIEEKQVAASSQLMPTRQPAAAEVIEPKNAKKEDGSGSSKSLLMNIRRRNKTDTEIFKNEKQQQEATGLPIGNRSQLDPNQTMIRKIEQFKANLANGTHQSNHNLLAGILAQGLLELGGIQPISLLKHSEELLREYDSPSIHRVQSPIQETAAAPVQKPTKPKNNELHNNSSIATISEKYSEEFDAESAEKQSNISLKHMYTNRQQLLDLKKRNFTDIKDFKKEANLDSLFNGDQSKVEPIVVKAINPQEDESEELGDALFKLNGDEQSFG
jgi:hypothetical protein